MFIRLSNIHSEKGAALAYLAVFLFLLLIIAFGYQIDMSFTAASSAQGQLAMDEAGFHGIAEVPDYDAMYNVAEGQARSLLDPNGGFTGPYYSSGLPAGIGNGTFGSAPGFGIWIPTKGIGNQAFHPEPLQPSDRLTLYADVIRRAVDPCLDGDPTICNGGQLDTWGNAVVIRALLSPTQVFSIGNILPSTDVEIISIAHEQSSWVYIVVDPTFPFFNGNAEHIWGPTFSWPIAAGTEAGQWPLVDAANPISSGLVDSGGAVWPGLDYSYTWQSPPTSPIGTTVSGYSPYDFATPVDMQETVHKVYGAACNNYVWKNYLQAIVRVIDMFTRSSAYNYFTMVGIDGGVPDENLSIDNGGAFNAASGGGPTSLTDTNSWSSWSNQTTDHLRTIAVHPSVGSGQVPNLSGAGAISIHSDNLNPLAVSQFNTPDSTNTGSLHAPKTFGFRGWININDPSSSVDTVASAMSASAFGGVEYANNKWLELCVCHGVSAGTGNNTCDGAGGQNCLAPDVDSQPFYDGMLRHDETGDTSERQRSQPGTSTLNWCSDGSFGANTVDFSDHRQGANETVRNIIAGLGPRVLNPNIPRDGALNSDASGDPQTDCDGTVSGATEPCWRTPVDADPDAGGPLTEIPQPDLSPSGCLLENNTPACRAFFPNSTAGYTDYPPEKWWLPGHQMLAHSLRHAVDMISISAATYSTSGAFQNYAAINPVLPENRAVVLFGLRPYSPITGANINGTGLTKDQMRNEWRSSLAWAACTNHTQVVIAALALDDYGASRWGDVAEVVEEFKDFFNAQSEGCTQAGFGANCLNDVLPSLGGSGAAPHQACTTTAMGNNQQPGASGEMARVSMYIRDFNEPGLTGSPAVRKAKAAQGFAAEVWSVVQALISKQDALL